MFVGSASAVISAAAMGVLWKEQPFFAFAAVAFYFMGGIRFVPWKTPIRKAIAIGIFAGILVSSAMFYWGFLRPVPWRTN
jgi:ABC-type Mn2+/Zn2+ transport system permease subunit